MNFHVYFDFDIVALTHSNKDKADIALDDETNAQHKKKQIGLLRSFISCMILIH